MHTEYVIFMLHYKAITTPSACKVVIAIYFVDIFFDLRQQQQQKFGNNNETFRNGVVIFPDFIRFMKLSKIIFSPPVRHSRMRRSVGAEVREWRGHLGRRRHVAVASRRTAEIDCWWRQRACAVAFLVCTPSTTTSLLLVLLAAYTADISNKDLGLRRLETCADPVPTTVQPSTSCS